MSVLAKVPKSITFLIGMTILTGVLYPAAVTLAAQLAFPGKANGSLLVMKGAVRGSTLLAQKFESPRFFHARPSASDYAYVGAGASNLGPVSADLAKAVADRRAAWLKDFGTGAPEGMLYASASGLDPDISLDAALAQVHRVAAARAMGDEARSALSAEIRKEAERETTTIGPPRVNVVSLNARMETDPALGGAGKGG
jgi:K+-transporting ATPase ATPase C chain